MNVLCILMLNLLWFVSVLGAANHLNWPSAVGLFSMLMCLYFLDALDKDDFSLMGFSLLFGGMLDGLLSYSGLIDYSGSFSVWQPLPPPWILLLWIGFGASVSKAMAWMLEKPFWGGCLMLIGAPLSYYSAERLGAVIITDKMTAFAIIALGWLTYFVHLVQVSANRKIHDDVVA